jgi:hypothetical protein
VECGEKKKTCFVLSTFCAVVVLVLLYVCVCPRGVRGIGFVHEVCLRDWFVHEVCLRDWFVRLSVTYAIRICRYTHTHIYIYIYTYIYIYIYTREHISTYTHVNTILAFFF